MSLKVIKEFYAAVVDSLMKQKEWTYTKNLSLRKSKNDNSTIVLILAQNLVDIVNKVAIQIHLIITKNIVPIAGYIQRFFGCLYFLE